MISPAVHLAYVISCRYHSGTLQILGCCTPEATCLGNTCTCIVVIYSFIWYLNILLTVIFFLRKCVLQTPPGYLLHNHSGSEAPLI